MPSYSEIMTLVGFKSKNAVAKLVDKLVEEGLIAKDSSGHLIPLRFGNEVPMLGLVEAGFPTAAEEELADTMSLDEYLIGNKEATYLLEVKGDSMIEAGIQEGDLVIAERRVEPKPGDIVIAEVDGGWTMKYFRRKGSVVFLEPANKAYKAIYPENDLKVAAVVKGVVRKY
jgi:repressor LexA